MKVKYFIKIHEHLPRSSLSLHKSTSGPKFERRTSKAGVLSASKQSVRGYKINVFGNSRAINRAIHSYGQTQPETIHHEMAQAKIAPLPAAQIVSIVPKEAEISYPRWFGGSASCMAVLVSHPFDLSRCPFLRVLQIEGLT